MQAVSMMQ